MQIVFHRPTYGPFGTHYIQKLKDFLSAHDIPHADDPSRWGLLISKNPVSLQKMLQNMMALKQEYEQFQFALNACTTEAEENAVFEQYDDGPAGFEVDSDYMWEASEPDVVDLATGYKSLEIVGHKSKLASLGIELTYDGIDDGFSVGPHPDSDGRVTITLRLVTEGV